MREYPKRPWALDAFHRFEYALESARAKVEAGEANAASGPPVL
jgi:hypothetical protein